MCQPLLPPVDCHTYSTLLVKHRCALKVHFNNDRCGRGVPIETYLSLYNFPETTNCTKMVHLNVHLGLEVYQKSTTPRSRCTLLLALGYFFKVYSMLSSYLTAIILNWHCGFRIFMGFFFLKIACLAFVTKMHVHNEVIH